MMDASDLMLAALHGRSFSGPDWLFELAPVAEVASLV